jgi:enamine deaminase RidA (YjgF/YER057c/UK114 family)
MRTAVDVAGLAVNPGYSHVINAANLLFLAGQVAEDSAGELVGRGDAIAQTGQAFANVRAVLAAAGATFDDVIKLTCYVTDHRVRQAIVEARLELFAEPRPACTYVVVAGLADPDFLVEIEAIAELPARSV